MLTLRYAVFHFNENGHSYKATCEIAEPSTWTIVMDNMHLTTIIENRTHQFVNQTRAKEIIWQALNSKK